MLTKPGRNIEKIFARFPLERQLSHTAMDKTEPKRSTPTRKEPVRHSGKPAAGPPGVSSIDWSAELAQHRGWLRSVLAARLGDRHAVEEVWQEVAVAAVASKSPPAKQEQVAPWLYKVAVRRALMYRRGKGRQRRMMQSYAEQRAVDAVEDRDPLQWLLCAERQAMVREAVSELHHRDQEMLLLKYTQDWSYAQIADHLGVTSSAVESRLHRARQRLRERMKVRCITSATS